MPTSRHFTAALHSRAHDDFRIRYRNSGVEGGRVPFESSQRTYDYDLSFERAGWEAIQLDARFVSGGYEADVSLIDGQIHQRLRVVDDIRKGFAEFQLAANQVFH